MVEISGDTENLSYHTYFKAIFQEEIFMEDCRIETALAICYTFFILTERGDIYEVHGF